MIKKLLLGAGMAYLAKKFMGGSRNDRDSDRVHDNGGFFGSSRRRSRNGFSL